MIVAVLNGPLGFFLDPFGLRFFLYGLLAAVLAVGGGAVLGPVSMLRQEAYLTQGVGQSMVTGAAIGSILGVPTMLASFAAAVGAAALVHLVGRARFAASSSAVAVVSSVLFAIGIAVISADRERGVNVSNVLFGNILGVSEADLIVLAGAVSIAVVFVLRNGRMLMLAALDEQVAHVHGVRVRALDLLRLGITSLVVAASVQVVGVSLVVVALAVPYLVVAPWTRSLGGLVGLSCAAGAGIGAIGMYLSYYADIPSGPAIVIVAGSVFVVSRFLGMVRR
jgi:ABC-type Mn2+/Zn2+ transport system permease subunit